MYKAAIYIPYCPGFYDTILSPNFDEIQSVLETDLESRLNFTVKSEERLEDALDKIDYWEFFDNEKYQEDVGESFVNALNWYIQKPDSILSEISFEFESIQSPRFYNFENDKINGYVTVPFGKLLKYMDENAEELDSYLRKHYSSRDGFMSFVPSNIDDFRKEITGDDTRDMDRDIGILVEFVIERELGESAEEIMCRVSEDTIVDICECEYCDRYGFADEVENHY